MKRIILNFSLLIIALILQVCNTLNAQAFYQYKVNLNKVTGDELKVELIAPKINKAEIVFTGIPKAIINKALIISNPVI